MPDKACMWHRAAGAGMEPTIASFAPMQAPSQHRNSIYVQDSNAVNRIKQGNGSIKGMILNRQKQRSAPAMGAGSNNQNLVEAGLKLPPAASVVA